MTLAPGTRLGQYEIITQLGAGGMGEVHKARDIRLQRNVAVKILPSTFAAEPERLARFEREAQVLASLNHPNIAQIYGVEEGSGALALVMELVDGPTLAQVIAARRSLGGAVPRSGTLDVDRLAVARQLAEALEVAHDQGIIHRDLKPQNIILRPDGTVKVLAHRWRRNTPSHRMGISTRWRRFPAQASRRTFNSRAAGSTMSSG